MTDLELVYEDPRQVTGWSAAFDRGEVPGRWLYGLDHLANDDRVRAIRTGYTGSWTMARRASLVARALAGRTRKSPQDDLIRATWDERNALKVLADGYRAPRLWSGLIWLTDDALRQPRSIALAMKVRMLSQLAGTWVLSSGQLGAAKKLLGPDATVKRVSFGIDHDFFTPIPQERGRPLIVSVGNDRDRDTDTLYSALRRVRAADSGVEIMVQTRSDLPPPEGVTRIPRLPHKELRALYRRATLVPLPAVENLHFSGMTAALEAMACGTVPIVSDTPGARDYVDHGVTGWTTPVGDPENLATVMLESLSSQTTIATMASSARSVVEDRFTHRHLAESLLTAIFEDA